MRQTFDYCYYCRESKQNKKTGLAHIELSISINGKRKYVTLPLTCSPTLFNRTKKPKEVAEYLKITDKNINKYIIDIAAAGMPLTIDTFIDVFKNGGIINNVYSLSILIKEYCTLIGKKDITLGQMKKYERTGYMMLEVITDKPVNEITNADIMIFQNYVYTKYHPNTAAGNMVRLKAFLRFAKDNGKMSVNPSANVKVKRAVNKEIVYLNNDEYNKLINKDMHSQRLNQVRDLWIFQANTGLSYCDMINLSPDDIKTSQDGFKYISKTRQKTNVKYTSVLLPDAIEILERYNYNLPLLSNQRYNSYIQECMDIASIEKHITTHCARHQYATRLLAAKVPLSTIQHCLGHSSIIVTERFYAALSEETIIEQVGSIM